MKKKTAKPSKGNLLALAILWTVIAAVWTAVAVLRFSDSRKDEGLLVMAIITMLASLVSCVASWLRLKHDRDDTHN